MKQSCPNCHTILEINENDYAPGEIVSLECPLCEEKIEFVIPNNQIEDKNHDSKRVVESQYPRENKTKKIIRIHATESEKQSARKQMQDQVPHSEPPIAKQSHAWIYLLLCVIIGAFAFLFFYLKSGSSSDDQSVLQNLEDEYASDDAFDASNANYNEHSSSGINNSLSNRNSSSEAEVTYEESEANDIESSEEPVRDTNGHRFVDLGLPSGVCWATCNLGAHSPSDKGEHFAWGETSSKFEYTQSTYDMDLGSDELGLDYDAAASQWGGTWRTPTREEWQELVDCCTWLWNGEGYWVSGKNGESIFLPAAGYSKGSSRFKEGERGDYWTSTPLGSQKSYEFVIKSDAYGVESDNRFYGISIRPVTN